MDDKENSMPHADNQRHGKTSSMLEIAQAKPQIGFG